MDTIGSLIPAGASALRFTIDDTAVPFLALFAFLWLVSGAYAWTTTPASERGRLFAYYVPSAVGGIGVAMASDAISFYLCFALMALPAWGLITHDRSAKSRRAGAVYLTLTAIGEALLLAALILMATGSGSLILAEMRTGVTASPHAVVIVALLLGSISLKIGTLPFSGVLPLSYTYTPAGAASALAGASAKVGALAMVRLLPAGAVGAEWVSTVMLLGLITALGAAVLGVLTSTPRAVLGYSSASQLGLILIAGGVSLGDAGVTALAHGAIVAFALHHGLAKSALVLGADVIPRTKGRARTLSLWALALPALALVGAPFTSGFVAKFALKDAIHALHGPVPDAVYALLPLTAIGTAALMLRFFALVRADSSEDASPKRYPAALWGLVLGATLAAVWAWPAEWNRHALEAALAPDALWTATWPTLVALAGWGALSLAPAFAGRLGGTLVPGDVLVAVAERIRTFDAASRGTRSGTEPERTPRPRVGIAPINIEGRLVAWMTASTIFVLLALAFVALAAL
ncbi:MAG: proton-conducting transporter membrane subunit [Coriobacteriia bacterium]|nr:proton-conducting transporter membrane subunit [Coriobacteriia bacterium]